MSAQRWIALVDLDAFFASVEELLDPSLRGRPVIVGGDPQQRGVVSSASYAARAYGVRSAMPVAQALRLCPQAILVAPRHGEYGRRSAAIMDTLREITPAIEQVSVDEAFLDLSGCERLWGPVEGIGRTIQQRIEDEHHLSASVGIACSKLVAKIACDLGKPHGLVIVPPGEEQVFLATLPIETLWGIGKTTGGRLRERGIQTVGGLAEWSEEQLIAAFGEAGHWLYLRARGIDESPLHTSSERRSVSQERTFAQDTGDLAELQRNLLRMSEVVASNLRGRGLVAQTIRLKLRYPDFSTMSRQTALGQPTDRGQVIYDAAQALLTANWHEGQPLRLLGVAASGLLTDAGYQLALFDHNDQREIELNRTLDDIRERYGHQSIQRASLLPSQRGQPPTKEPRGSAAGNSRDSEVSDGERRRP